jgi:predicted kinase
MTTYAFDMYFAEFKHSATWARMMATVENSPWHREANVGVHTEMSMHQYKSRFSAFRTDIQNMIALMALLYHDTGKPAAEEVKEKKDGSGDVYRSYAGHEQDSAVEFMEHYVRSPQLRKLLTLQQARVVRWIIEHHLPYGLKDVTKRRALRTAMVNTMGEAEETFYDCLRSDAAGRISDDHEQKLANVEAWITEFKTVEVLTPKVTSEQAMFMLIGPSGSGKTTWVDGRKDVSKDVIVSYDAMKLAFYATKNPDAKFESEVARYETAWAFANENEKDFKVFFAASLTNAVGYVLSTKGNLFIDTVNASKKKRAMFIELARKHGMKVVAVEFWNTLETLHGRQATRGDKAVPYTSIKQQQYATTCAWLGYECEDVMMVVGAK